MIEEYTRVPFVFRSLVFRSIDGFRTDHWTKWIEEIRMNDTELANNERRRGGGTFSFGFGKYLEKVSGPLFPVNLYLGSKIEGWIFAPFR